MSKFAWVTLTTNDTYSLGALVLAHSLRRAETAHQLAVLVTPGVSESMRSKLKDVYNVVQEVNVMDSQDAANLALLARPELGITFTKLHCWRLVQFEKCVFLDSDTLVLQNCDELFDREELSAAPDVSWPDCFNSGVFVYTPSLDTFAKITEFALKNGSFDGGDQGLLNLYFDDWAHTDIKKHLPFVYNVTAYASYCYLPAFKQFRDKIKILHFAGKMKPWLIHFNSESKTVYTPSDYAHASDLIQLWWNIFCDNVHQKLTDSMNYWPGVVQWRCYEQISHKHAQDHNNHHHHQNHHHYQHHHHDYHNEDDRQFGHGDREHQAQYCEPVKDFQDPWEDYYANMESDEMNANNNNNDNNNNDDNNNDNGHESSATPPPPTVVDTDAPADVPYASVEPLASQSFECTADDNQNDWTGGEMCNVAASSTPSPVVDERVECGTETPAQTVDRAEPSIAEHDQSATTATTTATNSGSVCETTPQVDANTNVVSVELRPIDTNHTHCSESSDISQSAENEAGLAGALSQLRLGEQRTPEQEEYEQVMRRQCWESGQVDYSGKDSFENIWKKISKTMDTKPAPASTPDDKSELVTSADIEDGKTEYNPKTKETTTYKVIDGGYEVHTKSPQPNGTVKTSVRTFWDPKPVNDADLAKEKANRKQVQQRMGKEVRIDRNTTMLTREIPGGYEEVYTVVNEDGTRSMRTKTFYDSVPEEDMDKAFGNIANTQDRNKSKKTVTRNSSVDSTDSTETRRVTQKKNVMQNVTQNVNDQQSNYQSSTAIEETRRVTQNIEITQNNRTVRKNSLQEQNIKAITHSTGDSTTDGKSKKKKTKSSIPPPPPDFIENDSTTVASKRVPGGVEYTYSTQLESGKTITTTKTVYAEEEIEMSEEEIREYKKTLKDAEKHKHVTSTKKLRSESGTKKIVPSENPGDVTTVETIKIEGGTEYHYTTVTAEGIVKKAVKTIYDPVATKGFHDEESEEEEIVEEYEEEIIEPGEKNVRTVETIKKLPQKFEEEVTITHERKEKKVKKSMMISH